MLGFSSSTGCGAPSKLVKLGLYTLLLFLYFLYDFLRIFIMVVVHLLDYGAGNVRSIR